MKKETDKQALKRYRERYYEDQINLYKNPFVRFIFNLGHKYIAQRGQNHHGTFLDIGSGIGYHLKFENISKKKKYICLDIDEKILQMIKEKRVLKLKANCEKIPLREESVDVVIASHVLEHVSNLEKCLKEVKRVLIEKGLLLVVLPCDPGLLWNLSAKFTPSRKRLKLANLDYDLIMRNEHVNSFNLCIKQLSKYFRVVNKKYYPFLIPSHNLNLICGIEFSKR